MASVYAQLQASNLLKLSGAAFLGAGENANALTTYRFAIRTANIIIRDGQYPRLVQSARDNVAEAQQKIEHWPLH